MDVDHVDPHLLDQVRLPAREHGESVAWIVAELLRPDIDGPGLPLPAAVGGFPGEDDELVAVGLELPAGGPNPPPPPRPGPARSLPGKGGPHRDPPPPENA